MAGPLSPEDLAQVNAAERRARAIRRAARVASIDGWFLAVGAAFCVPLALMSPVSLVAGVVLGLFAFIELRGATALKGFDPTAPRLLALNQLALLGVVVLYCAMRLYTELTGPGFYEEFAATHPDELRQLEQANDPALGQMGGEVLDWMADSSTLIRQVVIVVYSLVILLSILFQGLLALYYLRRRPVVESYLAETPPWVVELQRSQL